MRRTRKATDQTPRPPLAPLSTPAGPPTGSWLPAFLMRLPDFSFARWAVRSRPRIARMPRMGGRGSCRAASPSVPRALGASVVKTLFVPPPWSLRLEALPTSIHRFTPMDTDEENKKSHRLDAAPTLGAALHPCRALPTGSWLPAFLMRLPDFLFARWGVRTRPRIARMPRMGGRGSCRAACPSLLHACVVKGLFGHRNTRNHTESPLSPPSLRCSACSLELVDCRLHFPPAARYNQHRQGSQS